MDVWRGNVLNFALLHRIGYQFCDPVCAYGGNSKLVSGITSSRVQFDSPQPPQTRRKPTKIEVPKWASSDNNGNCEKGGSNTKSSAPQPPPPPPPPAPSAGLAINANVSHPLLVKNHYWLANEVSFCLWFFVTLRVLETEFCLDWAKDGKTLSRIKVRKYCINDLMWPLGKESSPPEPCEDLKQKCLTLRKYVTLKDVTEPVLDSPLRCLKKDAEEKAQAKKLDKDAVHRISLPKHYMKKELLWTSGVHIFNWSELLENRRYLYPCGAFWIY